MIHTEEEEWHSHKLHRDGGSIDDGIDAIPHGLDAITAISSIRVALLPFQSPHYVQAIHRIAMHCNGLQGRTSATPFSIEFAMSTGRYTRIRTRQHPDPLITVHPSRNAFAIALAHSITYTKQHSIHRFAESCDSSNLHTTTLHPTFEYINEYYNLHTHQRCLKSHFHSESPTSRFTTTFLHPTRHLLFIFPLSQPHLLSFHLFYFSGLVESDLD